MQNVEGDLPSASVLYNVWNGFIAFSGIDVEDVCAKMCALEERLCEMLHIAERHRVMLFFFWLKRSFRTGVPVTGSESITGEYVDVEGKMER